MTRAIKATKITQSQMGWAARRGMLECDLFLVPFVERRFEYLSDKQQQDLYELLQYPDPELYAWLMGQVEPEGEAARFKALILLISQYRLGIEREGL